MKQILSILILSSLILACEYPDEENYFSEHGVLADGSPWTDPMLQPGYFDDDWFNKDVGALNPIDTNSLARSIEIDIIDIFDFKVSGRYNLDLFRDYDIKETGVFFRGSIDRGWICHPVPYDSLGCLVDTISIDIQGLVIECFLYARDAMGDTLRSDTLRFKAPLIDFRTGYARGVTDTSAVVDFILNAGYFNRDSLNIYLDYKPTDSLGISGLHSRQLTLDSLGRLTYMLDSLMPCMRYEYYARLYYRELDFITDTKYFETDTTGWDD